MTVFTCELCNITTTRPTQYARHINTNKHKRMMGIISDDVKNKKNVKSPCDECGKIYADRSGLHKHKKGGRCKDITKEHEHKKTETLKETVLNKMMEKTELSNKLKELSNEIEELSQTLLEQLQQNLLKSI
jgi:hypothetical protein